MLLSLRRTRPSNASVMDQSGGPAFIVVLAIVAVDTIGIGLVMPVLPGLLRQVGHTRHVATFYGVLMATYAAMQFLFSPLLGAVSDRYGRRPVLLCSLAGGAVDYLVTAAAPSFGIIALGRVLAGVTGANVAVATSCLADITPADGRARRFGRMNAVMGLGLIAGPVLGGLLGAVSLRAPYLLAALLSGTNTLLVLTRLPETRAASPEQPPFSMRALLPSPAVFGRYRGVPRLVGAYAILYAAAQVPMVLWILYGQARFGWDARVAGLSIALYGLLHAGAQGFLIDPATRSLGERGTVLLGVAADATAYGVIGLASRGWVAFALLPLFCIGGLAAPALQAMISRAIPADEQGRLQGALVSLGSLIGIPGPIVVTVLFAHSPAEAPGAVWLGAAVIEMLMAPMLLLARRRELASAGP